MTICEVCRQSLNRAAKDRISCAQCRSLFHGKCVNLKEPDLELLSGRSWSCAACTTKHRLQLNHSNSTPVKKSNVVGNECPNINLEDLNGTIAELRKEILNGQLEVKASLKSCHDKLDNNSLLLAKQEEIVMAQQEIIRQLQSENDNLKTRILDVTNQLDSLEQYTRRNTVEIHGVRSTKDEDVSKIVLDVCGAVGMDVKAESIDCCHRLKKGKNFAAPGVVVRFVRRSDADELLRRRRGKKLTLHHIGMRDGQDQPIYINQSLTARRRVLFSKAKKLQKEKGWRFVWTDRAGNLKVRVGDQTKIAMISDERDLETLV
jgi:hypothetical protein